MAKEKGTDPQKRSEANEEMKERFAGEGAEGERGYRGRTPPDTPPGSVPGGSYGGGGGVSQGSMPEDGGDETVEES